MRDSTTLRLRVVIARVSIFILAVSQFLTLGLPTPVARAQTAVSVCPDGSCEYTTINSAINGTGAGDIVNVYPGTYVEDFGISQDRSVIGMGTSPDQVVVKGTTGSPTVQVTGGALAFIENLTIAEGGSSKDDGGGIKISSGAQLHLTDAIIRDNMARNGGAIHVSNNSSLYLSLIHISEPTRRRLESRIS